MAKGVNRGGSFWEKRSGKVGMKSAGRGRPTHDSKFERTVSFLVTNGMTREEALREARRMRV